MTEKRFTLINGINKGTHSGIWDKQKQNNQRIGDELWIGEVVSMLNEGVMVAEENEELKSFKDNIKEVLKHEYKGYEDKIWGTWIRSLSLRLGVDIND